MRATIQVDKIDDTHIRVTSEESVQREISEYFTFPVPGAKFMPSVRNRYWDGNIRLYSNEKLYTGLYYALQEFAKDREYEIQGYRWETDVEENLYKDQQVWI